MLGIRSGDSANRQGPWGDYTYDVFADDIKKVLETLDLDDVT